MTKLSKEQWEEVLVKLTFRTLWVKNHKSISNAVAEC
jgi:hypothetical protein